MQIFWLVCADFWLVSAVFWLVHAGFLVHADFWLVLSVPPVLPCMGCMHLRQEMQLFS